MRKKKDDNSARKDRNEREQFIYEGTIVEPLKNIMFHVRLHHNNQVVLGYLSGNMRRNRIRVLRGDRVKIEISEFDSEKGRIFYRFPPLLKQTRVEQTTNDHQAIENTNTASPENPISSDSVQSTDQRNNKDTSSNQDETD